jgi:hypothetical protein
MVQVKGSLSPMYLLSLIQGEDQRKQSIIWLSLTYHKVWFSIMITQSNQKLNRGLHYYFLPECKDHNAGWFIGNGINTIYIVKDLTVSRTSITS